ncbi:MAG: ATP-binding cassette domain-containing protein [Moraxella sp.]|nr:ATP-binding cassette domain-containing protein [Moraxella sp.]
MKTNQVPAAPLFVFQLRSLVTAVLPLWLLAWLLGAITVLSVLGLLMVSGWFITMSALAGLVASGSHTFNYLAPSAWIRTFAMARTATRYGELMVAHHAIFELLKNLRLSFFNAFARLDTHSRAHLGSSVAQHRLVKDIDILDEFVLRFVSPWVMAIVSVMVLTFGMALVFGTRGLVVVAILVSVLVLAGVSINWARPLARAESQLGEQRKLLLLSRLPVLIQLLTWHQWRAQMYKLQDTDTKLGAVYQRHQHIRRVTMLLMQWGVGAAVLVVLALGVAQIGHQTPIGVLGAALLLALTLGVLGAMEFMLPVGSEPMALGRSQVAKEKLNALLSKPSTPKTTLMQGDITLIAEDITVKQPQAVFGATALTFQVRTGVPLMIMGVSGGGKSTLLDTLAGEIALVGGCIKAVGNDGSQCDWYDIDWQGQLGYLGQRVDIFDKTLAENLRLGKQEATDDELMHVLTQVGLDTWVQAQPQGLATALGEYGMAISGGQARRIALARLLLSPKKVLLLDEPFAGLDDATRQKVWQELKTSQKEGLLVIVSHHQWAALAEDEVDVLSMGAPQVVR